MVLKVCAQFSDQLTGELAGIEVFDTNFVEVVEAVAIVKQETALSRAVRSICGVRHILPAIALVGCHEVGNAIDVVSVEAVRHVRPVDRPAIEIYAAVFITGVDFITGYSVVLKANAEHSVYFGVSEVDNRYSIIFLKGGKGRAGVSREGNELGLNVLRNTFCFCRDSHRTR